MPRKAKSSAPSLVNQVTALQSCPATKIKTVKGRWLVDGILPLGCLALLDGDKGSGKSHVAAAIAAYLTGGFRPDGWSAVKPSAVIWAAGEEDLEVDTKSKLSAAGANLDLIRFLGVDDTGHPGLMPTFPADLPGLEELVRRIGASFVFLDPLSACLPVGLPVGDEKANRAVASEMQRVMQRQNATLLGCRHLAKQAARDAVHAGLGSVSWAAVARAVLRVEENPVDGWERVLSVVRVNRRGAYPPRAFSIVGPEGAAVVEWGPALDKDKVHELANQLDDGAKLESCVAEALIRAELAKGPRHAAEVYAAGEKERISKQAMWRAAKKIGVVWQRHGYSADGYVEWIMPAPQDAVSHTPPMKSMAVKRRVKHR